MRAGLVAQTQAAAICQGAPAFGPPTRWFQVKNSKQGVCVLVLIFLILRMLFLLINLFCFG